MDIEPDICQNDDPVGRLDDHIGMKHELRAWRFFLKVVELGSVTRAASQLHLTQPALSRHLRTLEEDVGVELLMRHGRGVKPTAAGLHFRNVAMEIIERISRLSDELGATANDPTGQLAVGLPMSWARIITADLIPQFLQTYPNVTLIVNEGSTTELRRALKARQLDMAIMLYGESDAELHQEPLVKECVHVVGSKDQGFEVSVGLDLKVLAGKQMVMLPQETYLRSKIDRELGEFGASANIIVEINSLTLLSFVEQGLGVTILPAIAVDVDNPKLSFAPINGLEVSWAVATLKARPRSAAMNAFASMTKSFVEILVGSGAWRTSSMIDDDK